MTPIYQPVPFDPIRPPQESSVKRFACALASILALGIVLGASSSMIRHKVEHRSLREVGAWNKCHDAYMKFNRASNDIYSSDVHIKVVSDRYGETCYVRGAEDGFFENVEKVGGVLCDKSDGCFTIKPWYSSYET